MNWLLGKDKYRLQTHSSFFTDLKADTQREGECDDDDEPGDGGEQPPAHPDTWLRLVPSHGARHGRLLLAVDADCAHVGPSLAILVTSIGVNLNNISLSKFFLILFVAQQLTHVEILLHCYPYIIHLRLF